MQDKVLDTMMEMDPKQSVAIGRTEEVEQERVMPEQEEVYEYRSLGQ